MEIILKHWRISNFKIKERVVRQVLKGRGAQELSEADIKLFKK